MNREPSLTSLSHRAPAMSPVAPRRGRGSRIPMPPPPLLRFCAPSRSWRWRHMPRRSPLVVRPARPLISQAPLPSESKLADGPENTSRTLVCQAGRLPECETSQEAPDLEKARSTRIGASMHRDGSPRLRPQALDVAGRVVSLHADVPGHPLRRPATGAAASDRGTTSDSFPI